MQILFRITFIGGTFIQIPRISPVFSERERAMCYRPSVCRLSVCRLSSVTFVRPTQAVESFVNMSTALGTLAIH